MKGKCPKDDRYGRPVFVTMNGERTLVIADGKGDCYKSDKLTLQLHDYDCFISDENKVNPNDYEFERGLSGFDF